MRAMRYQPQGRLRINTRTTLAVGLVAVHTPKSGPHTAIGSAKVVGGPAGLGFLGSASSSRWLVSNRAAVSLSPTWTILGVLQGFEISGNDAGGRTIYTERPNNTQIVKLGLGDARSFSSSLIIRNAAGTSILQLRGSTNVKTATADARVIVGVRRATNSHAIYLNGVLEASSAADVPGTWDESAAHIAGDPMDANASMATASIPLVLCWNRALSDAEIAQVSANPWQLFAASDIEDAPSQASPGGGTLVVTPASLLLSGGNVAMRVSRRVAVQASSMAVAGTDVVMRASRKLGVQPTLLALTGGDAKLQAARRMSVGAAGLVLQPGAAQLRATRRLTVAPVTMMVTGGSIEFAYTPAPAAGSYVMAVTPAALSLTGGEVRMRVTRRVSVVAAGLVLAPGDVRLLVARRLMVGPAALTLAGGQVLLRAVRRLQVDPAQLVIAGGTVTLHYSSQIEYARAPAGSGYSPQRVEVQARPAQIGGHRPASIQRNNR